MNSTKRRPRALELAILALELLLLLGSGVVVFIAGHRPGIRAIGVSMALAAVALVKQTKVSVKSVLRRRNFDAEENKSRPIDGVGP